MNNRGTMSLAVICAILITGGCGPSAEMESENASLRSMIDSVRTRLFACIKQTTSLEERIDSLQRENRTLVATGKSVAIQPRLDETPASPEKVISREVPIPPPPSAPLQPPPVPAGETFQSQYQNALHQFNERNVSQAFAMFRLLSQQQPANDLTDNCLYWMGESYYALHQYQEALQQFESVLQYPLSDKADDALMMRGNCFLRLDRTDNARSEYKKLIERYPNSEYMERAKRKLAGLK